MQYNTQMHLKVDIKYTLSHAGSSSVLYDLILFPSSLCENNPVRYYSQMAPSSDFRKFLTLWLFGLFWHREMEKGRRGGEAVEDEETPPWKDKKLCQPIVISTEMKGWLANEHLPDTRRYFRRLRLFEMDHWAEQLFSSHRPCGLM